MWAVDTKFGHLSIVQKHYLKFMWPKTWFESYQNVFDFQYPKQKKSANTNFHTYLVSIKLKMIELIDA